MQDFTYHLFITMIISSLVFVKSKKTEFYTKKSFKALIFIFKLREICNLFPGTPRFHLKIISFLSKF